MAKTILYLGSGGMAGVFGGGIVTGLQEANAYKNIESVYGLSCGALNGAYFLAEQSRIGSSIYYENLINNFIILKKIPIAVYYRLKNKVMSTKNIPKKEKISTMNIDYLLSIVKGRKKLDIKKVVKGKIPLYVRVTNTQSGETKDIDIRKSKDPLNLLKAAVSMTPMTYGVKVKDKKRITYADGAIMNPINLQNFPAYAENKKIVIVLNAHFDETFWKQIKNELTCIVGGILAKLIYPKPAFSDWATKEMRKKKEIKIAYTYSNVLVVSPPKDFGVDLLCTDPEKLLKAYNMGIEASKEIVKFMKEDVSKEEIAPEIKASSQLQ
ncbi:patatin-like phospholipase family protein [Candidatus Pacearchaeota archaeon]|nr:patatin-like phospholipase family protein [Candidatus Pacearchaeota archaeon]